MDKGSGEQRNFTSRRQFQIVYKAAVTFVSMPGIYLVREKPPVMVIGGYGWLDTEWAARELSVPTQRVARWLREHASRFLPVVHVPNTHYWLDISVTTCPKDAPTEVKAFWQASWGRKNES